MICFYNTSTCELYNKCIKLTKKEKDFLTLLINHELVTLDHLKDLGFTENNIRVVKNRLVQKTLLNIETKNNIGYVLKDDIYII